MSFRTKSKSIKAAIGLFVFLDLTLLGINFWITDQVYEDAAAINLAGRQRMLSQRVTKVLLQIKPNETPVENSKFESELQASLKLFRSTLLAFKQGGEVMAGDGKMIHLNATSNPKALQLLKQTEDIIAPIYERLSPYLDNQLPIPDALLTPLRDDAIAYNQIVLAQMNALTSALEQESQQSTNIMRLLQSLIFLMALINFIVIIRGMNKQADNALAMSRHFSELAMRDPLTGLFNRRQFNEALEDAIRSLDEQGSGLALLMIDLDGFKPVNDTYGHDAGDEVLRAIGRRLGTHARASDTLARLGGDAFALICPNSTSTSTANLLCGRLIDATSQPIQLASGQSVRVGASIGIAFYPDHVSEIDGLIQAADKAMYLAKTTGKGRCVCANSPTSSAELNE